MGLPCRLTAGRRGQRPNRLDRRSANPATGSGVLALDQVARQPWPYLRHPHQTCRPGGQHGPRPHRRNPKRAELAGGAISNGKEGAGTAAGWHARWDAGHNLAQRPAVADARRATTGGRWPMVNSRSSSASRSRRWVTILRRSSSTPSRGVSWPATHRRTVRSLTFSALASSVCQRDPKRASPTRTSVSGGVTANGRARSGLRPQRRRPLRQRSRSARAPDRAKVLFLKPVRGWPSETI